MARIRTIKPEFFSDESLSSCSHSARLLAIALLQMVDSEGRMRLIPSQISAHTFPWEAVDLSPLLHELFTIGYARKYTVSRREYLVIPGFVEHQRLSGKEAQQKSKFPSPDQDDSDREAEGKEQSLHGEAPSFPGTGEQGNRGTGEQGNRGTGEQGVFPASEKSPDTAAKAKAKTQYSEKFESFWQAYPKPRRKEKPKAWTAWKREGCESIAEQIIVKLTDQIANDRQFLDGYEPFPERYLNKRKFEDEIDDRPEHRPGQSQGKAQAVQDANDALRRRYGGGITIEGEAEHAPAARRIA